MVMPLPAGMSPTVMGAERYCGPLLYTGGRRPPPGGAWPSAAGDSFAVLRQPPLAPGEEAKHDALAVVRIVGIGQAERVADFVHDRREQIDTAMSERFIGAPTVAGGIIVDPDLVPLVSPSRL